MQNFPSTTGLGRDSVFCLHLSFSHFRVICMFSHGPCALECSLADANSGAGVQFRWVARRKSEASATFRMAFVFFVGGLRSCTTCELLSKHFDTFCVFIAWKRAIFHHVREKSGFVFLASITGSPGEMMPPKLMQLLMATSLASIPSSSIFE